MTKCRTDAEELAHDRKQSELLAEYESSIDGRVEHLIEEYTRPGVMSQKSIDLHNFITDIAGDDLTFDGELTVILAHSLQNRENAGILLEQYVRGLVKQYLEHNDI